MPFGLKTAIRFPVVEIHLLSMSILHFQITVLAQFQRRVFIRYHKGKHHLNGEHQGMEIQDNGGLIQKFYVVGRCNAAETFHSFLVHIPFCFLQRIIILIIQKAGNKGKSPVREYRGNPFIAFSIFLLKAHKHRLWFVLHCHNHGKHFEVIRVPHRFLSLFPK